MTLRDWFAGQDESNPGSMSISTAADLIGVGTEKFSFDKHWPQVIAKWSYMCADAMIATIGGVAAGWLAQHWGYDVCFGAAAAFGAAGLLALPILMRHLAPPFPPENEHV